jgi:hypothetical protein
MGNADGCAFAPRRRPSQSYHNHTDQRKARGRGRDKRGLTMNTLKKIAIFCLVSLAATSIANARFL